MGFGAGVLAKATACGETEAGASQRFSWELKGLFLASVGASATVAILEESLCDICLFMDMPAFSLRLHFAAGPHRLQRRGSNYHPTKVNF